jgi:hypothetical protein
VKHFAKKEFVEMGCLAALEGLTPAQQKSKQWRMWKNYHPVAVAAAELKKKKKSPKKKKKKLKKKSSKTRKKPKKKMR